MSSEVNVRSLTDWSVVGSGRSGVVYFRAREPGGSAVEKVFEGDRAAGAVLYLLTGAPNPYAWCEDAVAAAVSRRRILATLVRYWFGPLLRLPETYGYDWNRDHLAFALRTEFVQGRHAPLRSRPPTGIELRDELVTGVMKPLQAHLRDAGFDGLVWQAGLGNPVAANNFMVCEDGHGSRHWVWIDLESGVPALFPLSPLALVRFYLPAAIRHRRPLFDDVDVARLEAYLEEHGAAIEATVGRAAASAMRREAYALEHRQLGWKSLPRSHRSIAYYLAKQRITEEQAEHFRLRPLTWHARVVAHALGRAGRAAAAWPRRGGRWLRTYEWSRLVATVWRFLSSQRFRTVLAQRFVTWRVRTWEERRHVSPTEGRRLRAELRQDETSEYIPDFGVHLAIKPAVKGVQYTAAPVLIATGEVLAAAILIVFGGVIARTAYTTGRLIQQAIRRQRLPWVALGVGLLPIVGSVAYPAQLAYRAERSQALPRFIVYDMFASIGRALPVWGGCDTLTEHWFNRLPDALGRPFKRLRAALGREGAEPAR